MSPGSSIQKPYSIASLPKPVNKSTSPYFVGDVHGVIPGSRKRKRTELAVGIDGENLNLYDVSAVHVVFEYLIRHVLTPNQGPRVQPHHFLCPSTSVLFHMPAMFYSNRSQGKQHDYPPKLCVNSG